MLPRFFFTWSVFVTEGAGWRLFQPFQLALALADGTLTFSRYQPVEQGKSSWLLLLKVRGETETEGCCPSSLLPPSLPLCLVCLESERRRRREGLSSGARDCLPAAAAAANCCPVIALLPSQSQSAPLFILYWSYYGAGR